MTNKQTGTSGLVERLEATIHQINGHWWNRRKRPEAPDIREAIDRLASLSPVPVDEVELMRRIGQEIDSRIEQLVGAILPLCEAYELNDCGERRPDDALEINMGDLRALIAATDALDSGTVLAAALTASRPSDDGIK